MKLCKQAGMTLLEITVVLLILLALAGLAIPYIGGTSRKALCDATDVSMANIKRAIMDRYYLDTLGFFPKDTRSSTADYHLKYLYIQPSGWNSFDPDTQTGWRGPYLQGGVQLNDAGKLDASFKDTSASPNNHVHVDLVTGDSVILDAWGRPFILQIPSKSDCDSWTGMTTQQGDCARLVSAGAGSGLSLSQGTIETQINQTRQYDDRVLYLLQTPPGEQNEPCGDN